MEYQELLRRMESIIMMQEIPEDLRRGMNQIYAQFEEILEDIRQDMNRKVQVNLDLNGRYFEENKIFSMKVIQNQFEQMKAEKADEVLRNVARWERQKEEGQDQENLKDEEKEREEQRQEARENESLKEIIIQSNNGDASYYQSYGRHVSKDQFYIEQIQTEVQSAIMDTKGKVMRALDGMRVPDRMQEEYDDEIRSFCTRAMVKIEDMVYVLQEASNDMANRIVAEYDTYREEKKMIASRRSQEETEKSAFEQKRENFVGDLSRNVLIDEKLAEEKAEEAKQGQSMRLPDDIIV
ncbi:MAG TPA: hypothetical protein IAB70_03070 [Candidatus Merdicola faecigallinarum]|uniref:Uncharacterized protein n=1 Tax=Candidatus Merdicola faecigallinarum TaxID=2840862 RepID=A0A9D1S991_9FIRM|nr:hypothetical protein [Candidatus Merdicola faecigallinarum]